MGAGQNGENKKGNDLKFAGVFDIDADFFCGPHNIHVIREKMQHLKKMGIEQVQIVAPPPGYPNYVMTTPFLNVSGKSNYHLESILNTPDAAKEYIKLAQEAGLKAIAVIKPYEGGGSFSLPEGESSLLPRFSIEQLGGNYFGYDNFIAKHPDMRVKRAEIPNYSRLVKDDIAKIEIVFCLDEICEERGSKRISRFAATDFEDKITDLKLFISSNNGEYSPLQGKFEFRETLEQRQLYDANGIKLSDNLQRCRVITIDNLKIKESYVAITFTNSEGKHYSIPYSMIRLYNKAGEEIPATVSSRVRNTQVITANLKVTGDGVFRNSGFEFQALDTIYNGNGWENNACYGIAKGKLQYMKGTHCEAYKEVRDYWLEQVEQMLEYGADGIDIRLQCHSTGVVDYINYGYNEPILKRFRQLYQRDPDINKADFSKIMQIRGDFFYQFLYETKKVINQAGKKLMMHLRSSSMDNTPKHNFGENCFWAMPKIILDWRKVVDLADEITFKDYNFGTYDPDLGKEIKDYVFEQNKPLWINCYLQQGGDCTERFCEAVKQDKRVTGVQFYELVHFPHENSAPDELKGLFIVDKSGHVEADDLTMKALKVWGLSDS